MGGPWMGGRAPGGRGGSLGAVWKALCLEDGRGALWTARRGAERGPGCGRDVDGTSSPRALLLALLLPLLLVLLLLVLLLLLLLADFHH